MEAIYIEEQDKKTWNDFVKKNGTLLQSWQWGELKEKFSWKPYRISIKNDRKWILAAQILCYPLPLSKSFLYVSEGPVFAENTSESEKFKVLEILIDEIKNITQKEKSIFLRLEPFLEKETDFGEYLKEKLLKLSFIDAFEDLQPQYRLWIDLGKSEDELLAQMKHKGRYNIKIAQKHNVNIIQTNDEKMLDKFYQLYLETAKRDNFSPRPKDYFENLLKLLGKENIRMYFAMYKNIPISSIWVTQFGKYAVYLYGATSSEYRETMSSYLIQWQAIKDAKKGDKKIYDLAAIAPSNEKHKWSGLRDFKMKFGGRQVNLMGCADLVYSKFWYNLFKVAERMRRNE